MLSGLKAIASGLQASSAGKIEQIRPTTPVVKTFPSTYGQNQPAYDRYNEDRPKGVFTKDYYGNVSDPKGKVIFSAPGKIDVSEDGTIYESGSPVGIIRMYSHDAASFVTSEKAVSVQLEIDRVIRPEKIVEDMIKMRAFQANMKVVNSYREMTGTIINLKS